MLNEIANVYLIWIRIFLGDPRCMFGALQMLLFGEYLIRFGLVHNLEKVLERYRLWPRFTFPYEPQCPKLLFISYSQQLKFFFNIVKRCLFCVGSLYSGFSSFCGINLCYFKVLSSIQKKKKKNINVSADLFSRDKKIYVPFNFYQYVLSLFSSHTKTNICTIIFSIIFSVLRQVN